MPEDTAVSCEKWLNQSRCCLDCGLGWAQGTTYKTGVQITPCKGATFRGTDMPWHPQQHCRELCKNSWTNRDSFWVVESDGLKEACVTWGCTLAPPGEYHWPIHVRRRCGLFVKLLWALVSFATEAQVCNSV